MKEQVEGTVGVKERRIDNWCKVHRIIALQYGKILGGSAILVYLYLASRANTETDQCYPSYDTISADLGISRATLSEALKKLEKNKLIGVKHGHSYIKNGVRHNVNNVYSLLEPPLIAENPRSSKTELVGSDTIPSSKTELHISSKTELELDSYNKNKISEEERPSASATLQQRGEEEFAAATATLSQQIPADITTIPLLQVDSLQLEVGSNLTPQAKNPIPNPSSATPLSLPLKRPKSAKSSKPVDERCRHAAVAAIREVTGRFPAKETWDRLIATLGATVDIPRLKQCRENWIVRGFNPQNLNWALEWYVNGETQRPTVSASTVKPLGPRKRSEKLLARAQWTADMEETETGKDDE